MNEVKPRTPVSFVKRKWTTWTLMCVVLVSEIHNTFLWKQVAAVAEQTVTVAIGTSLELECNSRKSSIAWVKLIESGEAELLSIDGQHPEEAHMRKKYKFTKSPGKYIITIRDIQVQDVAVYKCSNIFAAQLNVISMPKCFNKHRGRSGIYESGQYPFTCSVSTSIQNLPIFRWTIGNSEKQPIGIAEESGDGNVISRMMLRPTMSDHGKKMKCSLSYVEGWNISLPLPFCEFPPLNVKFGPKIRCPSQQVVHEQDNSYNITCDFLSNPILPLNNISMLDENDIAFHTEEEQQIIENGSRVTIKVPQSLLSVTNPDLKVTIKAHGEASIAKKHIHLSLNYEPRVSCLEEIKFYSHNEELNLSCTVLSNPPIPDRNMTWILPDGTSLYVMRYMQNHHVQKTLRGMKVTMTLDKYMIKGLTDIDQVGFLVKYKNEEIMRNITLMLTKEQMISDVTRGIEIRQSQALLESGGLVGLIIISIVVLLLFIILIAVAILCKRKEPPPPSLNGWKAKNLNQNTLQDPKIAGGLASGRGYSPMLPMTMGGEDLRTMSWMKLNDLYKAEEEEAWVNGFTKMVNAMYAKDTDQDGYLLVEEVQAVIDSYNMVYKLNIPQSAIAEAFKCCSNGMLVDFDTFLRIVATKHA